MLLYRNGPTLPKKDISKKMAMMAPSDKMRKRGASSPLQEKLVFLEVGVQNINVTKDSG